jgi:hypothetical protein
MMRLARAWQVRAMAGPFLDLTLGFSSTTGLCDLVFDGVGFPFDATPATPLLISLGSERRADPDDVPPGTRSVADTYAGGGAQRAARLPARCAGRQRATDRQPLVAAR